MHFIYLDESGNTGLDLNNDAQPVFTLCAMIVSEEHWQPLDAELRAEVDAKFMGWTEIPKFEIHGTDIRNGKGPFARKSVEERIAFRDRWMQIGASHGVRLACKSVFKKRFRAADWCNAEFGKGVQLNPHVAAFALLSRCIDNYLENLPGKPLGMFISDENKEVVADIEKSIQTFRQLEGVLRLNRIVEKGFFIDSSKSLPLQLCDLYTLSLRKGEERRRKFPGRSIDDSGIDISETLRYEDDRNTGDVLAWLKNWRKK